MTGTVVNTFSGIDGSLLVAQLHVIHVTVTADANN